MIRHVVMFGIRENGDLTPTQEARRLGDKLLELPAQIPFLRKMEVGDNAQLILLADFDSMEDCEKYAVHPAHVAVAGEIAKVKTSRCCVDYEI